MDHVPVYLSSKLPNTGTSIFSIMSGLANTHNALNLSQGFPDFEVSEVLTALVKKHMDNGHNQYAPMPGILPLREGLSNKVNDLYSFDCCPESMICITPGATEAIYCAITSIINEGDEAIVFDPAYDSYAPAIEVNKGIAVHVELSPEDFSIDWQKVKNMISSKTKLIIVNSPHNPSGCLMTEDDLKALEKITMETDIIVISDEVYEHIVFDKKKHHSILSFPELMKRSFAIFSFGKVFHITGWKMGYCIGPKHLMKEFKKLHQFIVFSSNTPMQYALAEFLENKEEYEKLNAFFQKKRDLFIRGLKASRFNISPAEGTYFQLLNYKNISDEDDMSFAEHLLKEHKVASIPISVFYKNNTNHFYLRFCFAKSDELIEKATEILCGI